MRYKLNNEISFLYNLVFKIIFIGSFGFLIYSILIQELPAIIFCVLFSSWAFFLNRKFKKFKTIEFDEENIYFDNEMINFKDIESIQNGVIILKDEGKDVEFWYSPISSKELNLLKSKVEKLG
ncbi:hypothetical protein [Flavobacterium sp. LC2016-01]|uniref:hypothetical protein n=1 Tax=Flavobacterium sp. LC2016-01 TaxID=2675876 RepID=UPI0012BAC13D|nr:hypothetical protein [Flavobacterium sp. LC2016-01]MTH15289.1 hypothetical protein [Flavobacterium sp. LC2016-01]